MSLSRVFWIIALAFFVCSPTFAATLYIDPASTTLSRGDSAIMAVRIMPDATLSECINVVDVVLEYSPNINPVDISTGNSILSLWVESPVINKETRTITFAGGIPNGYCGRIDGDPRLTNVLAEIIVRSPGTVIGGSDDLVARMDFAPESYVYLNDGTGTAAPLMTLGTQITLDPNPGATIASPWSDAVDNDTIPPEAFSIVLNQDPSAFGGKYFIEFTTTDKQTGISEFEIIEEPIEDIETFGFGAVDAAWIKGRSPYVLQDQTLNSIVRVRAIDKAGNEYVASLVPDEALRTQSEAQMYRYIVYGGVGFVLIALVIAIILVLLKRRKKKKSQEQEEVSVIIETD